MLWFHEIDLAAASAVGGKALNLALLATAGLPVPPGFVVLANHRDSAAILAAYEQLGRGLVAVRSSATDEDGSEVSFAGQQETILGVEGDEALLTAVERCRQSLGSERATAYRRAQGMNEAAVSMAVVVQKLVPAEVAGVLFTHDPLDASGTQMLVEAAWGLGEAVVSGRVMPDRFHVERGSGRLIAQQIAVKHEQLTAAGWHPLANEIQNRPSLSAEQLVRLAKLAEQIETYYGEPRDVEWAYRGGEFFILQARPITAASAADLERVRSEEIARVKALSQGEEVVWARYNLSEVLPTPTPLTWAIVRQFMSGRGGFGAMFRSLGYDPDPALNEAGFLDLICGRPYVNLVREPKLFFRDFPYGYDFPAIRKRPELGMYPQLITLPGKKTSRFWWRLPAIVWRMLASTGRIKNALATEANTLTSEIYPAFVKLCAEHRQFDLAACEESELSAQFHQWQQHIHQFAEHSLRPGVLAATALAELEQHLTAAQVPDPSGAARRLVMGVAPPPECDLAGALRRLTQGEITREEFLKSFGHRGPQEMELAEPRWSETPEKLACGTDSTIPRTIAEEQSVSLADVVDLNKQAARKTQLETALHHARSYLALRECSKHYLMLGFERLRAILRAWGKKLEIGDEIFYLDTLPEKSSEPPAERRAKLLAQAKQARLHRKLLLALAAPPVLFSDDLEAIGRSVEVVGATEWNATPLSFGSFEGPALVLEAPIPAENVAPGFVLVCPSTDPAWVPLFLKAGALVMESGGVLSHGAIVAREFGIPAVAGIANVQHRLRTGQRLQVDGTSGKVHVFEQD